MDTNKISILYIGIGSRGARGGHPLDFPRVWKAGLEQRCRKVMKSVCVCVCVWGGGGGGGNIFLITI